MKLKSIGLAIVAAGILASCSKETETPVVFEQKTSSTGVVPFQLSGANKGGNVTCDQVAEAVVLPGFEFSTQKQNYPFAANAFTNGVSVTSDGTFLSWSIAPPAGFCVTTVAVIVKGGPKTNIYYYKTGQSSDSGLHAPVNGSGNPAGLGNVTICYNLKGGCE